MIPADGMMSARLETAALAMLSALMDADDIKFDPVSDLRADESVLGMFYKLLKNGVKDEDLLVHDLADWVFACGQRYQVYISHLRYKLTSLGAGPDDWFITLAALSILAKLLDMRQLIGVDRLVEKTTAFAHSTSATNTE